MTKNIDLKNVIKDKSIRVAKRTGKATKEGFKSGLKYSPDMIIRSADNVYDEHEDTSTGITKQVIAGQTLFLRNQIRVNRSAINVLKKRDVRYAQYKGYIAKKEKEEKEKAEKEYSNKEQGENNQNPNANVSDKYGVSENDEISSAYETESFRSSNKNMSRKDKRSVSTEDIHSDENLHHTSNDRNDRKNNSSRKQRLKDNKYYKDAKADWKSKSRSEKRNTYQSNKIVSGVKLRQSSKAMLSHQSRNVLTKVKSQNDMGSHVIGTTSNLFRMAFVYRKMASSIVMSIVRIVRHTITSAVALVFSLPAILTAAITSVPIIIFTVIMLLIMSICSNYQFTGRVLSFVENEVYLEYRYDANVAPDEILSITAALGWTSEKVEDYEVLFAIMMDGKDDNWNISYEKMLDNVFNKYNPARNGWRNNIQVKRKTWLNIYYTDTVKYSEYLALYPKYAYLSDSQKSSYGTDEKVEELKQTARDALKDSSLLYTNAYINSDSDFFSADPLSIEDIRYGAATYKVGYRSFSNGAFHAGTDIAASIGTDVFAVTDAKVIYASNGATGSGEFCTSAQRNERTCGKNYGGNQVILQQKIIDKRNDEEAYLYTAYFHLQNGSVNVRSGDYVNAGEQIAKVGNTGMSYGSHLHLQSWISIHDEYRLPYSTMNDAITIWSRTVDAVMLCNYEFRNYIFGR